MPFSLRSMPGFTPYCRLRQYLLAFMLFTSLHYFATRHHLFWHLLISRLRQALSLWGELMCLLHWGACRRPSDWLSLDTDIDTGHRLPILLHHASRHFEPPLRWYISRRLFPLANFEWPPPLLNGQRERGGQCGIRITAHHRGEQQISQRWWAGKSNTLAEWETRSGRDVWK